MAEHSVLPSLRFADSDGALDFYINILGFKLLRGGPGETNSAVERGEARIMIESPSGGFYSPGYNQAIRERIGGRSAASLYIEATDLEDLHAAASAAGAKIVDPLADREWGQAEFTVEDPGGNWLTFWKAPPQS